MMFTSFCPLYFPGIPSAPAERHLVQVFVDLFSRHPKPGIADRRKDVFSLSVSLILRSWFSFGFPDRRKRFQFLVGIYRVAHQLRKKNVVFTVPGIS